MAIPTWVSAAAMEHSTTTLTSTMPASIQANDILILVVESKTGETVTLSTANGFAQTASSPQFANIGGGPQLTVFWKRAAGSDSAPVIADPGDHIVSVMTMFRGVKTSGNPWNISSGGNETVGDTSGSIPGATTTAVDCLVVAIGSEGINANSSTRYSAWANADLANVTERVDQGFAIGTIGGTTAGGIGIATGEKATAGAYGATTYTQSGNASKAYITLALEGTTSETHSGTALTSGGGAFVVVEAKGSSGDSLLHGGGSHVATEQKNAVATRDFP